MTDIMYDVPSNGNITKVIVTEAAVKKEELPLYITDSPVLASSKS